MQYHFITLRTAGKKALLADVALRTAVEQQWPRCLADFKLRAGEYVVENAALFALVEGDSTMLRGALELFYQASNLLYRQRQEYKGKLWEHPPRVQQLKSQEDVQSLSDFIVQKMLGGTELSEFEPAFEREEE